MPVRSYKTVNNMMSSMYKDGAEPSNLRLTFDLTALFIQELYTIVVSWVCFEENEDLRLIADVTKKN